MLQLGLRVLIAMLTLSCVTLSLACSRTNPLGKVSGTVTVDGKPVPKGTIIFESRGQRAATGRIQNGQIVEVTSYTVGDGASVGTNAVAVVSTEEVVGASGIPNVGEKEPPKATLVVKTAMVPQRYNDPGTSTLIAEIKEGENVLEFNLTAK